MRDQKLRGALEARRRVTREVRRFLDDHGFMEMDTPILLPVRDIAPVPHFSVSPSRGGVSVLRICPENALKRLVVSGFDRVYEIARNFRVEVPSQHRACEFTTVECYQAYVSYHQMLRLCQDLILSTVRSVSGETDTLMHGDVQINMTPPWTCWDFRTAVLNHTGIDLDRESDYQSLRHAMETTSIESTNLHSRRDCVNRLSELVEQTIVQPTFLVDHPAETICVRSTPSDSSRSPHQAIRTLHRGSRDGSRVRGIDGSD